MDSTPKANKRIAINTLIIYIRMAAVTVIGLFTTRYVLQALGVSDYGLYNVVAGLIAMLNVISTAMHTTTRRYINVEMGKPNGNLNKIFNISLLLHIGFGLFVFLLAETIGLYYIYHYLNVEPGKLSDALFVFQISTVISVIGLMNVPYQGLLSAYEKFAQIAIIDFLTALFKVPLVIGLIYYPGNSLRFYAIGMCLMSLISFLLYTYACYKQYKPVVSLKFYKGLSLYKEILVFNNYTALGAFAYIGRSQGATMLINYFFGTIVNGAFAIAYQIENYVIMLVNNLSTASEPQITQSYSSGDIKRSLNLAKKISEYSIYVMLIIVFPLNIGLEFLLQLWLGEIPQDSLILCRWILVSLFIRSLTSGIPPIIQATGKVKWFQIIGSILLILGLPISFLSFKLGYSPQSIIIIFVIMDLLNRIFNFLLLAKLIHFSITKFIKEVYWPTIRIIILLTLFYYLIEFIIPDGNTVFLINVLKILASFVYSIIIIYAFGLTIEEKRTIKTRVLKRHSTTHSK